jgi:hypothetical protein
MWKRPSKRMREQEMMMTTSTCQMKTGRWYSFE